MSLADSMAEGLLLLLLLLSLQHSPGTQRHDAMGSLTTERTKSILNPDLDNKSLFNMKY